jgi:tetratricopeptide (TPR) repeat protein
VNAAKWLCGVVAGCLWVVALASPIAHAQSAGAFRGAGDGPAIGEAAQGPVPPGYDEAVERGFQAFEAGNYDVAREQFGTAHALYPNARTLRALGKVAYELSLYHASIGYLEQALMSSERPLTAAQRSETEDLLVRVRSHLAPVTLAVQPPIASVLLDGQPIALPADGRLMLAIGDHLLELSAPGYRPERHPLRVVPAADQRLSVLLSPAEPHAEAAAPPSRGSKWWLWTSLGVAVVAGAVTGAVLATRDAGVRDPSGGSTGMTISIPN